MKVAVQTVYCQCYTLARISSPPLQVREQVEKRTQKEKSRGSEAKICVCCARGCAAAGGSGRSGVTAVTVTEGKALKPEGRAD